MFTMSLQISQNPLVLFRQFEVIEDPRIDRHKRYLLSSFELTMYREIQPFGGCKIDRFFKGAFEITSFLSL